MSKYKYTSLLSSQYRQVFKSYHSLDRCEQELKDNLNKSLHKRIHTEIGQIEARNSILHYQKPQFSTPVQRPQTYLHYKTRPKYTASTEAFVNRTGSDTYGSNFGGRQNFDQTKRNRYDTLQNDQQYYPTRQEQLYSDKEKTRTNYQLVPNTYKKHQLKTKASQINKRRNDIKLIVRVKDIDKINKRYEYLTEPNQPQRIGLKESYQERKQIYSDQRYQAHGPNTNLPQKLQKEKFYIVRSEKLHQRRIETQHMGRNPLMETNTNRILMMKKNKPNKDISRNAVPIVNDEENVQTPHFYQTQVNKSSIQPGLISIKLQNLVKNTFTDRY